MIATHTVKVNGLMYRAGEEIPALTNKPKVETQKVETPKVEPVKEQAGNITKTDINRMSSADLRAMASKNGIENPEELTGGELKKALIEKMGL